MGTLTMYFKFYLESDIRDEEVDDDTLISVFEGLRAVEAARLIEGEGLTFEASGGGWASDPDGSFISDYETGELCERSAHLSGFADRVVAAIIRKVG